MISRESLGNPRSTPTPLPAHKSANVKDRVGRSGRDSPWGHLNAVIYLDIKDKDTYYTPKNSLYSYHSGGVRHHCLL